jgi:hypothetical protein
MKSEEIINFLRENVEPINDTIYGNVYCASVCFKDNTVINCVQFINAEKFINLAIKRFAECHYTYDIIKHFVIKGNCINDHDIKKIMKSKYTFTKEILNKIKGETLMSWTGFVVEMDDGKLFNFSALFDFCFFDFPENYTTKNIKNIINHSFVAENGNIINYRENELKNLDDIKIYREKPYFKCYVNNL